MLWIFDLFSPFSCSGIFSAVAVNGPVRVMVFFSSFLVGCFVFLFLVRFGCIPLLADVVWGHWDSGLIIG